MDELTIEDVNDVLISGACCDRHGVRGLLLVARAVLGFFGHTLHASWKDVIGMTKGMEGNQYEAQALYGTIEEIRAELATHRPWTDPGIKLADRLLLFAGAAAWERAGRGQIHDSQER